MYTLSSWRNHLSIVAVHLLRQKPARNVGDPLTAYVPGEITHVLRMTNVHYKYLKSHLGIVAVDLLHQESVGTVGDPFTAYVLREVTQVSRIANVYPKFFEMSSGLLGCKNRG